MYFLIISPQYELYEKKKVTISSNLPSFFKTYNFPENDYFISLSISSNSGPIFKL